MTAAMLRDKLSGVASSAKGRIKIGTEKSRRWEFRRLHRNPAFDVSY